MIGNDDALAAHLFIQYAQAFHGRHQLQFSRGLKHRYQIEEISDEQLSHRQDEDAILLGSLTSEQWRIVCQMKQRGALLEAAAVFGWEGVRALLDGLQRYRAREGLPDG